MTAVETTHIHLDKKGVAWIDQTNTKVIEVALDMLSQGWTAEEIHFQHPHLSLAQIHAALAYYYDHRVDFDAEIERRYQKAEAIRKQFEQPLFDKKKAPKRKAA